MHIFWEGRGGGGEEEGVTFQTLIKFLKSPHIRRKGCTFFYGG
jgi:hypothetical protein